jgi:hypothetical protein
MAKIIKPPAPLELTPAEWAIFLSGSIEMGVASNWQADFEQALRDTDAVILNPRRDEWDDSWEQRIENPQFQAQVEWELAGMERAEVIVVCFVAGTKSPITLLELGLFARSGKLIVYCPEGYWRKGNVDVVCRRYGVKTVNSFEELVETTAAVRQKPRGPGRPAPLAKRPT